MSVFDIRFKDYIDITKPIAETLEAGHCILIHEIDRAHAETVFRQVSRHFDLEDSFDLQMGIGVDNTPSRDSVSLSAVSVNHRSDFQLIQPHSEGNTTMPMEIFGLHCTCNSEHGGETVLGLVDQAADFSALVAREKFLITPDAPAGSILADDLLAAHGSVRSVDTQVRPGDRVLETAADGTSVVVRDMPVEASPGLLLAKPAVTLWDNVTVHDRAFHRFMLGLMRDRGLLVEPEPELPWSDEFYFHIEPKAPWGPIRDRTADIEYVSSLFKQLIVVKLLPDQMLLVNNRLWTHAANNWAPSDTRILSAMYA